MCKRFWVLFCCYLYVFTAIFKSVTSCNHSQRNNWNFKWQVFNLSICDNIYSLNSWYFRGSKLSIYKLIVACKFMITLAIKLLFSEMYVCNTMHLAYLFNNMACLVWNDTYYGSLPLLTYYVMTLAIYFVSTIYNVC